MEKQRARSLTEDMLAKVASKYGVSIAEYGSVEGGYRNLSHSFTARDAKQYNFILYKNEPGSVELIKRTNALGSFVAQNGLPVRSPVDERIL